MPNKNMFASILFFCLGLVSMAQGGTPPPPTPPPPPGLPIDNGVTFVFILALLYGGYRAYQLTRQKA